MFRDRIAATAPVQAAGSPDGPDRRGAEDLPRDGCRSSGSMGDPIAVEVEGRKVWTCCDACPPKLKADPAKYLAAARQPPHRGTRSSACPSRRSSTPASRKIVYVEAEPGVFEGREVVLGPRSATASRCSKASPPARRSRPPALPDRRREPPQPGHRGQRPPRPALMAAAKTYEHSSVAPSGRAHRH